MKDIFKKLIGNPTTREFFIQKIGEEGLALIRILLKGRKYVSEFVLAEHSGIYVNTVRSLLYKLYEDKVVSYTRKREKSRGWYIYSWMIHPNRLFEILTKKKRLEIKKLKSKLEAPAKEQRFYCKKCDVKLLFSAAIEYNFSCPNCYEPMKVFSEKKINIQNKKLINQLEMEINKLKELREFIKEETIQPRKKKVMKKKAKKKAVKKVTRK